MVCAFSFVRQSISWRATVQVCVVFRMASLSSAGSKLVVVDIVVVDRAFQSDDLVSAGSKLVVSDRAFQSEDLRAMFVPSLSLSKV